MEQKNNFDPQNESLESRKGSLYTHTHTLQNRICNADYSHRYLTYLQCNLSREYNIVGTPVRAVSEYLPFLKWRLYGMRELPSTTHTRRAYLFKYWQTLVGHPVARRPYACIRVYNDFMLVDSRHRLPSIGVCTYEQYPPAYIYINYVQYPLHRCTQVYLYIRNMICLYARIRLARRIIIIV